MEQILQSVQLFSTKDGADKEYQLRLVQVPTGFLVQYSNGKRGSTLRHGLRTENPVDEATARKEYERVLKSKLKDGYTECSTGEAFVGTDLAGRKTAFAPHLLTAIDESKVPGILGSNQYLMQIKHDGERRYAAHIQGEVVFANRQGLEVPAKAEFAAALRFLADAAAGDIELDCEDMGTHLVVFDILRIKGVDQRSLGFVKRFERASSLECLLRGTPFESTIKIAHIVEDVTPELIESFRANKEEGLCFKKATGVYFAGRNEDQFKLKFWESATVRVLAPSAVKRSVSIEAMDESGNWVALGNVTIPPSLKEMPKAGSLIDVQYLYAYEGGGLCQPSFERVRTDLLETDASTSQLKYKRVLQAA